MRRTKMGVLPSVDVMEPRALLSQPPPPVRAAMSGVVRDVRAIMRTLAKTGNTVQASAHLTTLSSRIPSGPKGLPRRGRATSALSPSFREVDHHDAAADPRRPLPLRPGWSQSRQSTDDRVGSTTSTTPSQGTGGGTTTPPVPTPSFYSVTIQNTTGLALAGDRPFGGTQTQQPSITETIPRTAVRACPSISGPRPTMS